MSETRAHGVPDTCSSLLITQVHKTSCPQQRLTLCHDPVTTSLYCSIGGLTKPESMRVPPHIDAILQIVIRRRPAMSPRCRVPRLPRIVFLTRPRPVPVLLPLSDNITVNTQRPPSSSQPHPEGSTLPAHYGRAVAKHPAPTHDQVPNR